MMRDPTIECSCCGSEEPWLLHNIRNRGSLRRVCTSCVLKLHPGSFCPHCFEVYEGSLPHPHERVMCSKCSSVSHLACVGSENARQYVCPSCSNPSFLFFGVGSSNKKSKASNGEPAPATGSRGVIDQKLAKVFLSAARIAASSMAKAAAAARVEAERRVKEAASTKKRAKEALERVAFLMVNDKEKGERKGKGLMVTPAYMLMMEQNKKAKGNTVAAAVATQTPSQKDLRTEGKDKSRGIQMLSTIITSTDRDRWVGVQSPNLVQEHPKKGVSVNDKDKHKGPSALVARQQVQNPIAVSANENSSNLLKLHNHVGLKEEDSNGVLPASPVDGQLQHADSHDMEEHKGKSGRYVVSDPGSQQPQSNQDPMAAATNSGVLLAGSSNKSS